MTSGSTLSVVVVHHESEAVLPSCLHSARQLLPGAEIIVVDNASTTSAQAVTGIVDSMTVLTNEVNEGFSRACNRGARVARGKHLLFLNPDVRLLGFPEDLDAFRAPGGRLGIVAPMVLTANGPCPAMYRNRSVANRIVAGALSPYWPAAWGRAPWSTRAGEDWVSGAAFCVDRHEFLSLGGFNEDFFFLGEDCELGRRYRMAGLPLRAHEAFICSHARGTSSPIGTDSAWRRYLAVLAHVEYWSATADAARALRRTRALLTAVRAAALLCRMAASLGMSSRVSRKSEADRRLLALLDALPLPNDALRASRLLVTSAGTRRSPQSTR